MKNIFYKFSIPFLFILVLNACGTPPVKATPDMKGLSLSSPPDKVHKAALDALAAIECEINTNTAPSYVDCKRPNKVGLAVGSGGETISVYIEAKSATSSEVKVNTAKSFVGFAGQRNWDDQVISEIEKSLTAEQSKEVKPIKAKK